jgi:hypothetical protein
MLENPLALKMAAAAASAGSAVASVASTHWAIQFFGVPAEVLFAGFAGSVIALAVLQPMPRGKMLAAVATGTLTAAYCTLPLALWRGWGAEYHFGIAFGLGVIAHAALTWIVTKGPEILTSRGKGPSP